jgi:hypothetical protein
VFSDESKVNCRHKNRSAFCSSVVTGYSSPFLLAFAALLMSLMSNACGYRVSGRAIAGLPPQVRTIAIPPFQNQTFQFKIDQKLTAAVIHEFLARTSYRIQSEPEGSDAILEGIVTSIASGTIVFDPASGRSTKVLVTVGVRVSILDTKTRQPLYAATNLLFREPYEVSTDPATYFAENSPALDRLSRDVASSIVSTIKENF